MPPRPITPRSTFSALYQGGTHDRARDHDLKALDLVIGATERDAAVASAVEVERNSKRARRNEQRRYIKDMEKLGYEFTGTGPDGQMTFRKVKDMARRNSGPKLRWRAERNEWVITWTEQGCTRKRSTGTASREEAKSSSANGSAREADDPARVIPLKCS